VVLRLFLDLKDLQILMLDEAKPRKPEISRFFSVIGIILACLGKTSITGLIFLYGNVFFRSWVNNLMVFKKAVLVLKK